jgi:hypothetical protein
LTNLDLPGDHDPATVTGFALLLDDLAIDKVARHGPFQERGQRRRIKPGEQRCVDWVAP